LELELGTPGGEVFVKNITNQTRCIVSGIFCIENGHISWDLPGLASGDMIYHKFSL
jgi:hypothetical protein